MIQDTNCPKLRKVCLIYDVENVGGGIIRAKVIRQLLDLNGISLSRVVIAGPRNQVNSVADAFRDCEDLEERPCPYGRQVADVELATQAGLSLARAINYTDFDALFIASGDNAVIHCGCTWIEAGYSVTVIIKETEKKINLPPGFQRLTYAIEKTKELRIQSEFDFEDYPFWFDSIPKEIDGLIVLSLPISREPIPQFIPMPLVMDEIRVGSRPGTCDVALDYWENDQRISLYSPHAFIGYSANGWYLRSAHGHRTKGKIVQIGERIISAQNGNCPLTDGDIIQLGFVKFKFQACKDDVFIANPPSGQSVHEHLRAIEQWFHKEIAEVLSAISVDWWENMVPSKVKENCLQSMSSKQIIGIIENVYRFTLLLDLQRIIIARWDDFANHRIRKLWLTKNEFRKMFTALNEIRKKEDHPTRLPPTEQEAAFIQRLSGQLF